MTLNVGNLSPYKLKQLRKGETITIRYASSHHDAEQNLTQIIYDSFPKQVATAFSSIWAEQFPSAINQVSLEDLSRPKETSVTVVGGSLQIIQQVLTWALSCCDGQGMQQFQTYREKPFFKYFVIKQNAAHLGISCLEKEMEGRLIAIAARQIHSEDVRAMYRLLPVDHPVLKEIAAHIGTLIWEKKLRAYNVYRTLREELPQFDANVSEALDVKAAAWQREKKSRVLQEVSRMSAKDSQKKGNEDDKDIRRKGTMDKNGKKGNFAKARKPIDEVAKQYIYENRLWASSQTSNMPVATAQQAESEQDSTHHKTVRCTVSRRAHNGRPAYVTLPLAAVGVSKNDFTGDSLLPRTTSDRKTASFGVDSRKSKGKPAPKKDKSRAKQPESTKPTQTRTSTPHAGDDSVPSTNLTSGAQSITGVTTVSTSATTSVLSNTDESDSVTTTGVDTPYSLSTGQGQDCSRGHNSDHCPSITQ